MDVNQTSSMTMATYFYATEEVTVFFETWKTTTWSEMFGSCLLIFFLSTVCEAVHFIRLAFVDKSLESVVGYTKCPASDHRRYGAIGTAASTGVNLPGYTEFAMEPFEDDDQTQGHIRVCPGLLTGWLWLETLLYVIEIVIGYCLMLAFMTYNVFICISVLGGAGVGYALFGGDNVLDVLRDAACKRCKE